MSEEVPIVHILGPSVRDDYLTSMRPCPTKEVSSYRREVDVQLPKGEAVTERFYPVQITLCYKGTTVQVSRF